MVDHYQTIRLQRVEEPKIRLRVLPRIPPLEIELQNTGTMVQWRVGTTGAWQDLIPISDLDADISIGTVTTLPAGSSATVVNSGTAQDAVLDFGIPRGQDGLIASIVAGINVTVDDTDPANPIVSAISSAAVDSVNGATGVVVLDAGDIGVTPAGNIAATDVQAAIEELDAEKQPLDADLTALATAFTRATNSGPASLALAEDTDNGAHKINVTAPAAIASDKTATLQDVTGTLYVTGGQDVSLADGGTGASLADPNADRVMFWDDSAGQVTWLTMGTGLAITGTTLAAVGSSMTLLGTLTTTSGTTQSLTGIVGGYRELYCEVEGVSFNAAANLTVALSSTNGAAYGATINAGPSTASGAGALSGTIRIMNISSTVAAAKSVQSVLGLAAGGTTFSGGIAATDTAAVVDAIQFAGGTFDAGTIRVYGVR